MQRPLISSAPTLMYTYTAIIFLLNNNIICEPFFVYFGVGSIFKILKVPKGSGKNLPPTWQLPSAEGKFFILCSLRAP